MISSVNIHIPRWNYKRLSMRELATVMDATVLARDAFIGVNCQPRCQGKAAEEVESWVESLNELVEMIADIAKQAKPATIDEANVRAYILIHYETTYPDNFSEVVGMAHLLHEDIQALRALEGGAE